MTIIDQNSIIKSQENALVPGPLLIDGRTELDMLNFLNEFATLINFYDNSNTITSNWAPFLLKDPVFLLASISKTNFDKYQSQYREISLKLEQIYGSEARAKVVVPTLINQLFDLLISIFIKIERWTYYMQNSAPQYGLKTYVLDQVKTNFSVYFWAIIALRDKLSQTSPIQGIESVKYYLFDNFDKVIWNQNKDRIPYWQVLGAKNLENKRDDLLDLWGVFSALTRAGDELFNFFHIIVSQSAAALENIKKQKSNYPDTTLLRTFVNLLQGHQEQLNGISQKHLQFYYQDILKQTIKPAIADSVFVYAMTAQKNATFKLPAGTLLNAGIDSQKNPILFASSTDVELNPGAINSAYTLNKVVTGKLASLYMQSIPTPATLKQDVNGKTVAWNTFGDAGTKDTLANVGIAFASPMLLLREGSRKITVTMIYANTIDPQMLLLASYYLSTQNAWLQVTPSFAANKKVGPVNQFVFEIDLNAAQPPIEPFLINPDDIQSVWPMLKISFDSFTAEITPVVVSIKIDIDVLNVKTFQLYNDHGALSSKTPYQLFGPLPLVNSNFIIGNNEIFSKPVNSLGVEFTWNNLPTDFATYYNEYNNYLNPPPPQPTPATQQPEKSIITKIWDKITDKHDAEPAAAVAQPTPLPSPVFNNCSFGVNFKLLQLKGWTNLKVSNQMGCTVQNCTSGCVYTQQILRPLPGDPPLPNTLFSTSCIKVNPGENKPVVQSLNTSSFFAFDNNGQLPYDPTVQLSPLIYTETSTAGFMKMELAIPQYGFGAELYPKVVANIATLNALTVYQISKDNDDEKKADQAKIIQPANMPFAPEVSDLVAHYSASQTYTFNNQTGTYPIQCFLYAPFQIQEMYNSTVGNISSYYAVDEPMDLTAGLPLFPATNYNGYLLLAMDDLVPANSINLYFEFSRKYGIANTSKSIAYNYLSTKGWANLSVLKDGTNGLSCSGILKVNVPEDITNQNAVMPGNKYWFAIKVNNPASYADTVFVTTNGFAATRTGGAFLSSDEAPHIAANAITKFQTAIPQVMPPMQPFPSFGGKPAEQADGMNQRVSNRLKTKDRAIMPEDYFRLIKHEYPEIYFSKTVFNRNAKNTNVYVVKGSKSVTDQDAFRPMITECKEENITAFLAQRASAFAGLAVSNFNFLYVCVNATVAINPGFEPKGLQHNISNALNVFLSPWIASDSAKINIDQSLTDTIVARFLKDIIGVANVKSVSFQSSTSEDNIRTVSNQRSVILPSDDLLIVPYLDHQITIEQ